MKKSALVTGSASGIGKAVCETLSAERYRVVIADINVVEGVELVDKLNGFFVKADLTI